MNRQLKQSLIVHGAWLLVAVSTFVLGARVFPVEKDSKRAMADSDLRSKSSAGARAGQSSSAGGSERRPGGSQREGLPGTTGRKTSELSEQDIERLGEEFRKASSPIERRLAFSRLLEGLTVENALQVREQIAHMHHHSAEFREFHYAWGAVAGKDAIVFGIDTEEDDMTPALAGWASANPGAAQAWFSSLDPENDPVYAPLMEDGKMSGDDLRNHLMGGLVYGLADADPTAAAEFLSATMATTGNERTAGLMHVVAEAVMRTGSPAEASQWAEALPEGRLRGEAMERVADRFVDVDPREAAAWAERFEGQPEGAGVIGEVGANWAWSDPQAALTWLQSLPEGDSQNTGMARAYGAWAHRDLTAAGEHLQAMPASPARDAATMSYSQRAAWEDPRTAMAWAETISSDEHRQEAMIGVALTWSRKDPEGAAAWVGSSGLPQDVQATILNPGGGEGRE